MADPTPPGPRLVLASGSPRRLDLLRTAGLEPQVRTGEVDETPLPGEEPIRYVARLARAKAAAVPRGPHEVVLAADTTVILDGQILGKPGDPDDAAAMLARLAGRAHRVATGVAVVGTSGVAEETVSVTEVVFAPLSARRIAAYVASGEPMGKAGAYAIQGRGAALVSRIDGSYTNVVGLPLVESLALLERAGVPTP